MLMTLAAFATEPGAGITAVPQEGFNLRVRELASPTYAVLTLDPPTHGWFAGTFTGLPTDQPVTFGFSMDGNDDYLTPADVSKWRGLRPVMSYADPLQYDSYVGYVKDETGHWQVDDPFTPADRDAGTGTVPKQQVVPPDVAAQFLSTNGQVWYPWREVTEAQALTGVNVFRMIETFAHPTATVAMRVPYPCAYLHGMLERLQAAQRPGVYIDTLGTTPGGYPLTVIRLEPPDLATAPKDRPTILAYAREHATEPEGSWVIDGMLRWLLSDALDAKAARQQCDWLLIPLLDPDDAARAVYNAEANIFFPVGTIRPEAIAYATYLINWVDARHKLEVAITVHNIECNEGPNLFTPLINGNRETLIRQLDAALWEAAHQAGFAASQPSWSMVGLAKGRLAGWCYKVFHTLDLFYEVNGRAPTSRLSPVELREIGRLLAQHGMHVVTSESTGAVRAEIVKCLQDRETARAAWWQRTGRTTQTRANVDILTYGY